MKTQVEELRIVEREVQQEIRNLEEQIKPVQKQIRCLAEYYKKLRSQRDELERKMAKVTYCPKSEDARKKQNQKSHADQQAQKVANLFKNMSASEQAELMNQLLDKE